MVSRKDLAVSLSRLKKFQNPKLMAEQYSTYPDVAADIIWHSYLSSEIEGKLVADFGAGTGILGIACLILGAKKVFFVEKDIEAIKTLKENIELVTEWGYAFEDNYEIMHLDVNDFTEKVDMVIENPPFGTKIKHADKKFLEKAFECSDLVYSFHKTSTEVFIKAISADFNYNVAQIFDFDYPLKKTHDHHKKEVEVIKVSCYKLVKIESNT